MMFTVGTTLNLSINKQNNYSEFDNCVLARYFNLRRYTRAQGFNNMFIRFNGHLRVLIIHVCHVIIVRHFLRG